MECLSEYISLTLIFNRGRVLKNWKLIIIIQLDRLRSQTPQYNLFNKEAIIQFSSTINLLPTTLYKALVWSKEGP